MVRFAAGLVCLAVGVALVVTADVGAGTWTLWELAAADHLGVSLGVAMAVSQAAAVMAAAVFGQRVRVAGLVAAVVVGPLVDVALSVVGSAGGVLLLVPGAVLVGVGAGMLVAADVGLLPYDLVYMAAVRRSRWGQGPVRVCVDVGVLVVAWVCGRPPGWGTVVVVVVVAAVVGPTIRAQAGGAVAAGGSGRAA